MSLWAHFQHFDASCGNRRNRRELVYKVEDCLHGYRLIIFNRIPGILMPGNQATLPVDGILGSSSEQKSLPTHRSELSACRTLNSTKERNKAEISLYRLPRKCLEGHRQGPSSEDCSRIKDFNFVKIHLTISKKWRVLQELNVVFVLADSLKFVEWVDKLNLTMWVRMSVSVDVKSECACNLARTHGLHTFSSYKSHLGE